MGTQQAPSTAVTAEASAGTGTEESTEHWHRTQGPDESQPSTAALPTQHAQSTAIIEPVTESAGTGTEGSEPSSDREPSTSISEQARETAGTGTEKSDLSPQQALSTAISQQASESMGTSTEESEPSSEPKSTEATQSAKISGTDSTDVAVTSTSQAQTSPQALDLTSSDEYLCFIKKPDGSLTTFPTHPEPESTATFEHWSMDSIADGSAIEINVKFTIHNESYLDVEIQFSNVDDTWSKFRRLFNCNTMENGR